MPGHSKLAGVLKPPRKIRLMEEMDGMLEASGCAQPDVLDWNNSRRSKSRISQAKSAGFSCFSRKIRCTICGVVTCLGFDPPIDPERGRP